MVPVYQKMINKIPVFIALFYLTFYIPFALTAYNTSWYKLNCHFHSRCDKVGKEIAYQGMEEVTGFLMHTGKLKKYWSDKERLHLAEVRGITDFMFVITAVFMILLLMFSRREYLRSISLINLVIISSLFLILPFFASFWRDIFHNLLFDNNYWLNTPNDLSYYVMPRKFFRITVATILVSWLLINLGIYFLARRKINTAVGGS